MREKTRYKLESRRSSLVDIQQLRKLVKKKKKTIEKNEKNSNRENLFLWDTSFET